MIIGTVVETSRRKVEDLTHEDEDWEAFRALTLTASEHIFHVISGAQYYYAVSPVPSNNGRKATASRLLKMKGQEAASTRRPRTERRCRALRDSRDVISGEETKEV